MSLAAEREFGHRGDPTSLGGSADPGGWRHCSHETATKPRWQSTHRWYRQQTLIARRIEARRKTPGPLPQPAPRPWCL